jgi:hypothetical protein
MTEDSVTDDSILKEAQAELRRHAWDTFVDRPPSIAQGGRGIVTPGCSLCGKKLYTCNQFVDHLATDVLPGILEKALTIPLRRL